jgi:hypothetical protein
MYQTFERHMAAPVDPTHDDGLAQAPPIDPAAHRDLAENLVALVPVDWIARLSRAALRGCESAWANRVHLSPEEASIFGLELKHDQGRDVISWEDAVTGLGAVLHAVVSLNI